jgi:hypothetical protein
MATFLYFSVSVLELEDFVFFFIILAVYSSFNYLFISYFSSSNLLLYVVFILLQVTIVLSPKVESSKLKKIYRLRFIINSE